MTQGVLSFQYEEEKNDTGMTSLAGLPTYLDLSWAIGLWKSIEQNLQGRKNSQGWSDAQMVMSFILLNLAGGDCVSDLEVLDKDEGFGRVLRRIENHGLSRQERRKKERRWRKEKKRSVPSPSAGFRYLSLFHDPEQERLRQPNKAFIPAANQYLQGFAKINRDTIRFVQRCRPKQTATLDMDATLVETAKSESLYCYKGFKSYQPLNTWWAEQEMVLHTEFRDGNVPAGYQQLRVFKEALKYLPAGVQEVRLRSDTAGYQHDLLKYCDSAENKRFGRILFAVGCDVSREFKKAVLEVKEEDWKPIYKTTKTGQREKTDQEWAEVCFVPNAISHKKCGLEYRYLAVREAISRQLSLPETQPRQLTLDLPFPTLEMEQLQYKVFGTVTNMDWDGEELIHWQRKRCGKSEEVHSVMKEDLAGGKFPSGDFGENAAWWWMMVLALNLNQTMKRLVLGKNWVSKRLKAIRFSLINLPGRVIERSRQLAIRLSKNHPGFAWLIEIRQRIAGLVVEPSG